MSNTYKSKFIHIIFLDINEMPKDSEGANNNC